MGSAETTTSETLANVELIESGLATENQRELNGWLAKNAPSLAELYQGALFLLRTKPPGFTRLISHAVREIRNRLPDFVAGKKSSSRLEYRDELDQLAALLPPETGQSDDDSGGLRHLPQPALISSTPFLIDIS